MFKMLALSHEDTEKLLDMTTVVGKVEEAFNLKYLKEAELFPMIFHEFVQGVSDMDIKSGHLEGAGIFGLKLVSLFTENAEKNIPQLIGTVLVLDQHTGVPKAILSAEHITSMRTGAAGAIGAKYLARQDSKNLLIVGTGNQAAYQIAATLMVMPDIEKVYLWNPIDINLAKEFNGEIAERLEKEFLSFYADDEKTYESIEKKFNVQFEVVEDIEKATKESDIIITITPSRKPLIMKSWVKPGAHFSCVGSDISGKQEIDEELFKDAVIYTDDLGQSMNVGEAEIAFKKGIISKASYFGEIGSLIAGKAKGRSTDDEITIFDSTGIALQDLITADYAIKQAKEKNIGSSFNL